MLFRMFSFYSIEFQLGAKREPMQVGCLAVLPSSWRDLQIFVFGVCVTP